MVVEEHGEREPTLRDVGAIEEAIDAYGARLVVIDPLMAYLPGEVNAYRDQDVRLVLRGLMELATRKEIAVLVVRHLNKSRDNNPLYRGGGSICIIGAARAGLLLAADPADKTGERPILAQLKNNLARPAPALAFKLQEPEIGVSIVEWSRPVDYNASTLLSQPGDDDDERSGPLDVG